MAFEAIGYEIMGEYGIPGRRFLRKGREKRTHHIHIFQYDNTADILRHLAYRNYLRSHPDACKEYAELKTMLATKYPTDIESYCNGKDNFIKQLEQKALKHHWQTIY